MTLSLLRPVFAWAGGVGLAGGALTGAGLALCAFSPDFLVVVLLGLFLNWIGDSFDGSLARYRDAERPRYGFLIDHSVDLLSTTFIVVGLGLSPYLPIRSACFILITYLLFCSFVYVKVAADGVHQLAFGGLGATEFRLIVAAWVLVVEAFGLQDAVNYAPFQHGPLINFAITDLVIGAGCVLAFFGLGWIIFQEAAILSAAEPVAFPPGKVIEILKRDRQAA